MAGAAGIISQATVIDFYPFWNKFNRANDNGDEICYADPNWFCRSWYEGLMEEYYLLRSQSSAGARSVEGYNEDAQEYNERCPLDSGTPRVPYLPYKAK